jgi:ubiquinone/menaquinone biosynthesis C-methylase UbiE
LPFLNQAFQFLALFLLVSISATTLISLLVSLYVYDLSGLYKFKWMNEIQPNDGKNERLKIVNINAGFDETSSLIQQKFLNSELIVLDFYAEEIHTEVSIKRARKAYPPFPDTQTVTTSQLLLESETVDLVFLIFSAHEIREEQERVAFLNETKRILKPDGKIILIEHLQDLPNFIAYNIGFFHFHSLKTWKTAFQKANLEITSNQTLNPFVHRITLQKDGNTP